MSRSSPRIAALGVALTICLALPARAQTYPSRPITIVVPFPPAGATDPMARIVQDELRKNLGQPIVIENRPGSAGNIGAVSVARAPADGHTLMIVANATLTMNPHLYKSMPFDPLTAFTPIAALAEQQLSVAINPSLPIHSIAELIDYAKKNPGKVSYGSTGIGSSNHLSMELFKSMAGIELVHVPYKGSAPMVNDMLGGHIDIAFDNTPNVLPQVNGDKLRALGVSSKARSELAPNVPTVSEAGVPGYEVSVWFGIVGPAGMRPELVQKLNAEMNAIFKMDDVKRRFVDQGVDPVGGTPSQFADHIRTEIGKWAKVVKDANIQPE